MALPEVAGSGDFFGLGRVGVTRETKPPGTLEPDVEIGSEEPGFVCGDISEIGVDVLPRGGRKIIRRLSMFPAFRNRLRESDELLCAEVLH